jgi:hypothetical protein
MGAEVIRWNAGDGQRSAGFVKPKKMRVRPDISAVERYIDGQIPENSDPLFPKAGSQPVPLLGEEILCDFNIFKHVSKLRAKPGENFGSSLLNFGRPPVPDRVTITLA